MEDIVLEEDDEGDCTSSTTPGATLTPAKILTQSTRQRGEDYEEDVVTSRTKDAQASTADKPNSHTALDKDNNGPWRVGWNRTRKYAGERAFKHFQFYDFCHKYVPLCVEQGFPMHAIRQPR